jgi:hypothetical protein
MTTYKRVSGDYVIKTLSPTDIVQIESTTTVITGDLSVSGNASLLGNISGDKLFNGTSNVEIVSAGSNVTIGVGGTSVAQFATTGEFITGLISVTGNVIGGNLVTSANVSGGNLVTTGNIVLTRSSTATTTPIIRFTDSNTTAAIAANIGGIEWFTSDATGALARVTAAIKAVYSDVAGNANILIQYANTASLSTAICVLGASGNVGVANVAPLHTLAVSGTMYGSSTFTAVGNVTGGNISTAGLITSTGNVTGGNITTGGLASVTGNTTSGNIISLGAISAGAGGVSATGNIIGGNVNSNGLLSVTGNIIGGNVVIATTVSMSGNVNGANALITGNITGANLSISTRSSGSGIGVENIVWQPTTVAFNSVGMANVGSLGFLALAGSSYRFEAYLPTLPDGSTTTGFSTYFDAGTCYYTVEAQTTQTSALATSTSNVSGTAAATQSMTGTTPRTVRLTGTIYSAGNANVTIQAQTSAANINVQSGSYLTYTRIG